MAFLVYDGPADSFDTKNITGDSIKFYPAGGAAEVRPRNARPGQPVEFPDDKLDELMLYAEVYGHQFRNVENPTVEEPQSTVQSADTPAENTVPVVDAETGENVRSRAKKGGS